MILELLGHETRTAHDGAQALEIARAFHPDVMVVDIAMPKLSGHELARYVRSRAVGARHPLDRVQRVGPGREQARFAGRRV